MSNHSFHSFAIDAKAPVKLTERKSWAVGSIQFRVGRGDQFVKAIRQGIEDVLPLVLFDLFTPKEFQQILCGTIEKLNVAEWRRHTMLSQGGSRDYALWFFEWLSEASEEDKRSVSFSVE